MEQENDRETTQLERAQISRRRMLWIVTSAGIIDTGMAAGANRTGVQRGLAVLNAGADTVTTDDILFQDDFEDYSVGSFPENWSQSGNSDQQVVNSPVASGAQALEMTGSYGGCWQALAHDEFVSEVPSDRTLVFSGHIHPTGTGGSGCHGNNNGNLGLQDSPSSAAGRDYLRKLIQFRADGTVSGSGLDLGSCQVGEYNSFEITYHWDSSTETVDVSYTVNGENRGSTTVNATTDRNGTVVESELSYLTLISGDYKLYVDGLLVTATPPDSGDVSLLLSITDATAGAGGTATVTYILTNEGNAESTGLQGVIDLPPGDWALGESGSFTSLGPGESESVSAEILVPKTASGEYTIDGSVTDGAGNEASASATITVEETGEPEFEFIAEASPDTVAPGEETTLEFSITNVGDAVSEFDDLYAWLGEEQEFETAFPNMGPFEISSHNDDNGTWDFGWLYDSISPGETRTPSIDMAVAESASPGEYTFALENVWTGDDPAVATVTLTVAEESSQPDAAFTYTPEQPFIDDVIEFDASSSADPDGAVITYEWRLGADDEFAERGEQFSVAADEIPEESAVTLRVTDSEDETDTTSQTVTVRGKQFQQTAETKLSNAAEIEQAAVYLSETQDVENLLSELRTDLRSGSFSDESIPTETVRRHQFGELTTLRLLEKTGPVDTLGNEQIAVKTTAFTVNLGVSLVMMQLSFTDLLSKTSYGSYLPDPQRQLDAIDNAVNDIVSFGFSAAQQTEAISEITDTAQEAYNQLLDGQFENADEFQQFLTDSISGTISTLTLQRAVETGAGFTPFAGQTPLTVVDQFANAEGSLDYLQANLDSESVQTNGLEGTLDGAIDAHDEAKAVIDQIASITDTFLSELENNLGFLSIIGNIYELLTGIHNIQGGALRIVGALAVLVPKSGLAVATVRAIGSLVGEVSLRLMMTANAYGVFGVKRGDPLDLEDIAALIPEPADILGDIEAVDERWGDVA